MIRFVAFSLALVILSIANFGATSHAGAAYPDTYHYSGHVGIEPDTGYLKASWDIEVPETDNGDITFFVRDTFGNVSASGADVISSHIERTKGFADFWAIRVTLRGADAAADSARHVTISYDGILLPEPLPNRINTISANIVELNVDSFWFPIDSRFSKMLTADVTLTLPGAWHGISTGEVRAEPGTVHITNREPRLDVAFTLAREPNIRRSDRFEIFDLRERRDGVEALFTAADICLADLNSRFGQTDPLPVGKLVITDRDTGGYARENYIVLTDIADTSKDKLTQFICHEFAHYWAKGADFTGVENWLNEAFAEYAALMSVRAALGEEVYETQLARFRTQVEGKNLPPVWRKGDTERGSDLVQYRKAPLLLAELEKDIGRDAFLSVVQTFFAQRHKTTPMLLDILESKAGSDVRDNFTVLLAQ